VLELLVHILDERGKVDRRDISGFQELSTTKRQPEHAHQMNPPGGGTQLVANPTRPLQKVGIITGKTQQAKLIFQEDLLDQIDVGREAAGIGAVVFFRKDKWPVTRHAPMQFHDPRGACASNVFGCSDDAIGSQNRSLLGCSFEERVPVGSEYVGPR